jgi:hypothetical protein
MPRFHPKVRCDVSAALRHYDSISDSLGDDFFAEFERLCVELDLRPERFHFDPSGWRRANLRRFPYHLLFYQEPNGVRVMTLRHDRRNPRFGLRRK